MSHNTFFHWSHQMHVYKKICTSIRLQSIAHSSPKHNVSPTFPPENISSVFDICPDINSTIRFYLCLSFTRHVQNEIVTNGKSLFDSIWSIFERWPRALNVLDGGNSITQFHCHWMQFIFVAAHFSPSFFSIIFPSYSHTSITDLNFNCDCYDTSFCTLFILKRDLGVVYKPTITPRMSTQ